MVLQRVGQVAHEYERYEYDNAQSGLELQAIRSNFHDYESYETMVFE